MRDDARTLDKKIDDKTDFVVGKIDHFIGAFHEELARDRIRFEEDRYVRTAKQRDADKRLDDIESRLDRLEAVSS